ncbi:uncharacterized protein LOC107432097 [Ziziphus jujuba]|uniref:Uncharacterized protein LOC107432097 n=2 Tax=Ziziphus jujuba TaxID=326968 RepID=A0A6P4BHS9_ZIZJJ|nr:uncharacterized protein LOC107432097 [Ziziphus jujuba]KAH7512175.1 hypothetical protein FEM48_Zijuj12G0062600 [Ziziphus jujuba var. spinosa]
MASPKLAEAVSDSSDFPPADVDSELNPPTKKKGLEVDPISSEVATSLEIKERVEAEEKQKARGKKDDALQTLKTTIIVSGVILAVAGAVIAITKKLREK